jgi:hypothetical protein
MTHLSGLNRTINERFFPSPHHGTKKYLPEPGLAYIWQSLTETPEVSIRLGFRMTNLTNGRMNDFHAPMLGRYSEGAQREQGFKNLNEHLLTMTPPIEWSTTYPQFGELKKDEKKTKTKKRQIGTKTVGKENRHRVKEYDNSYLVSKEKKEKKD